VTSLIGNNKLKIPPRSNEIEISVFGPGYGECVLFHVGDNNWFIVDSCIHPVSKEPIPLTYLNQINVDPATSIKQVIATHWHDDHIRGLGEIFRTCSSAEFICSGALNLKEFLQLVYLYSSGAMIDSSGIDELSAIIKVLQERQRLGDRYGSPTFAIANRVLWRKSFIYSGSQYDCSITSLSPSDASKLAAMLDIKRLLPRYKEPKRRLVAPTPNRAAVVLWVSIGDFNFLLGSDLEETNDSNTGWSVIVNSTARPQGKASFFKIPHHGAENAHCAEVWTEMLIKEPIAVLTPFEKGDTVLPTTRDVERLCMLSKNLYSTAHFSSSTRTIKRERTVEKTIRETVKNIRQINTSIGHVRYRLLPPDNWKIELFGDAFQFNCN